MASKLKADSIASYIRELLDGQKGLRDDVAALKRQQRNIFGPPPVPFAGMFPALDPQHHDVVKIYKVDAVRNYWEGQLCKPTQDAPFWIPDTDLGTISGVTPDMVSVPDVDELVEVFFSGMYDNGSGDLDSQYGMFGVADARPGLTTAYAYEYPTDPESNVYEVQTLKARFTKLPGKRDFPTSETKDVVIAMNWVDNPTLLPQGTRVTVHRHNGQWWFRQRPPASSTTSPGSCTITVVVTAYGHLNCCSPTYAQTCTYTNTYTYVSTCSTGYDLFLQTYITSCVTLTSVTQITSCTTVDIGGYDVSFTASYSFSSGCR